MAEQTTAPPPGEEDLRCEYQTSEAHVATLTSGVWQSAAIVVGGSIAAFAVLIDVPDTKLIAAAVSVLALGVIVVTAMWRYNWSRHKVSIDNCWVRMRDIERDRGMRKNIGLYCFTKGWGEFPEPPGSRVLNRLGPGRIRDDLRSKLLPRSGQDVLQGTALLAQVGWFFMAVFKWVDAFVCW